MNKRICILSSLSIIGVFLIILFLNSCEKNSMTTNTQSTTCQINNDIFSHVSVKNGALCFDSAQYVSQVAEALQKMSSDERKEWESKMVYKSMRTCIDEAYEKMNECITIEDYVNIINTNSDILKQKGEEIEQIMPIDFYTFIINREYLYYIGNAVVKMTPTSKIIVWSGEKSKLDIQEENLKSTKSEDNIGLRIISDDVTVTDYLISSQPKTSTNGTALFGDREYDKRKVKFWITAWRDDWGNHTCDWFYRWRIEIKIQNWKKVLWWKTYGTICWWEGVDFEMNFPIASGNEMFTCNDATYIYNPYYYITAYMNDYNFTSSDGCVSYSVSFSVGPHIQNNPLPLPEITWARGRASNRGLAGRYAGICYNTLNCHNLN